MKCRSKTKGNQTQYMKITLILEEAQKAEQGQHDGQTMWIGYSEGIDISRAQDKIDYRTARYAHKCNRFLWLGKHSQYRILRCQPSDRGYRVLFLLSV